MKFLSWAKWFLEQMFGTNAAISFGRVISGIITIYFLTFDGFYYFQNGHKFVDNSTLLTQLGLMTAFYGINKGQAAITGNKPNA